MNKKQIKILIVCSSGGHLLQLIQLKAWWRKYNRAWLTFNKPDAIYLLAGEKVYWGYHPTTRNYWNLIRNFILSLKIFLRERPDIVVSTGAGIAIPAFYLAKGIGARTIFIEAFNRVNSPTLTGRVVHPVCDQFFVQWESQRKFYKKAKLLGRLI